MNDPQRPIAGTDPAHDAHPAHDELLVAALAADDLEGDLRTSAERMVASCSECHLLFDDLRAIASATAVLPAMPRSRDFRLSPEDAARLRPMGWRRLVAAFASTRFAVTRPLAVGLSTLGLAGLLLSALPGQGGIFGNQAAAPQPYTQDTSNLGEKGVTADASGRSLAGGAPQAASSPGEASAVYGQASPVATAAAVSMPPVDASAAAASRAPQPSAAGGGSSGSSGGDNPSSLVDISPGPPIGVVGGGPYGANSAGAPPPDAYSSGKMAPVVPELSGGTGGGGGASPLAVLSVLCLVAGIGLFAVRSAAQRTTRS